MRHPTLFRLTSLLPGVLVSIAPAVLAQRNASGPEDAILNVVVWGTHRAINPAAYSGPLKTEVDAHLRRAASFRSKRAVPEPGGLLEMVHAARVSYERRLAAVTADPRAPRLAAEYVDALRPCYEWEGFHDCPQREAVFADNYQAAHQGGPFSEYLPLLAAHRWLCAAEAFDYEKRPGDGAAARGRYQARIAVATMSKDRLLRTAAEALAARERCF